MNQELEVGYDSPSMYSPVSTVVRKKPATCLPDTPVKEALKTLHGLSTGSIVVMGIGEMPIGIFTLHDLLNRVAVGETDLNEPISRFMSGNLITLPLQAPACQAALAMVRHNIHHVLIMDDNKLAGVVSKDDIFGLQWFGPRRIGSDIQDARDLVSLVQTSREIRLLGHKMLTQGLAAELLTHFISTLNDLLTRRIIELEFAREDLAGIEFCWIAMGSEGRFEQTFSSDQDNGIIFRLAAQAEAESARAVLSRAADRVNHALAECDLPLCRGGIMAGNPINCLSLTEWQKRFATWIDACDPEALLNATIFFDFRPLYGETALSVELRTWLAEYARDNNRFLLQMTQNALENQPPLGLVRDFVLTSNGEHPHTLDFKVNGITPFVDAARILALASGVTDTNTPQRLRIAGQRLHIHEADLEAWIAAFLFIQALRLRHQDSLLCQQKIAHNHLDPNSLNKFERRMLKEAMRQARKLQLRLARNYSLGSAGYGA